MEGVPRGSDGPDRARRATLGGTALLVVLIVADIASPHTFLGALLVVAPLVAALGASERTVAALGAAAVAGCLVLGQVDHMFFGERHVIALVVVAAGSLIAIAAARTRTTLAAVHDAGVTAYQRIALLDRSSRLTAAPMDFRTRLQELAQLPVPEMAELCIIDLATPEGQFEGAVVAA